MPVEFWYDGCCEPYNPGGHAGYGLRINLDGQVVFEKSHYVGSGKSMSNNVAEYSGAIAGLEFLLEKKMNHLPVTVYGDNLMSINQMGGRWRAKRGLYIPFYQRAQKLIRQFPKIRFVWIPRHLNSDADELSKKALRQRGVPFRIQPESA